jgi:hypothetical protein
MYWLQVDALEHHWQAGRVEAKLTGDASAPHAKITTGNITALSLRFPKSADFPKSIVIDGTAIDAGAPVDGQLEFAKVNGKWSAGSGESTGKGLQKRHGLQGPIDDAFMDHFLIVRPTGKPFNEKTGQWVNAELEHAIDHWRKQFRGEALVKDDRDVTDQDIAEGNLILFGDPSSNAIIQRIVAKLPIQWTQSEVKIHNGSYKSESFVPVMIYPNPLNPAHYVVLNSGFTFREYDYLNNARQTPKLPDYAVVDTSTPRNAKSPGGIAAAGFFGEKWELSNDDGRASVNAPAR